MRRIAPLFLVLLLLSLPLAAAQPPRSSPPPSPSALAAVGAQLVAYLHELVGRFLPAADSHGTMDPNG
ncbi:MAG TPA: hypothetical protein VHR45_07795, partial [Thermoanaerobaculia bacterium]|nr:hypothetical protein [Thermoanaerobaculia bacterium]